MYKYKTLQNTQKIISLSSFSLLYLTRTIQTQGIFSSEVFHNNLHRNKKGSLVCRYLFIYFWIETTTVKYNYKNILDLQQSRISKILMTNSYV